MARRAATSQNRFKRAIMAILRFFGRMLGLYRPATDEPQAPEHTEQSNETLRPLTRAEKQLRFRRALLLLDLAVAHARHEFPDSARGLLNAAWNDLESNPAARIQWRATTALVYAIGGNTHHATEHLDHALGAYESSYHSLSPAVRHRIYQLCASAMEHLPHSRHIHQFVDGAHAAHKQGDFVAALRLLDQADTLYTQHSRLISPRTNKHRLDTWYAVLEDMSNRGGRSTSIILDAFRTSQHAPANSFAGAAA